MTMTLRSSLLPFAAVLFALPAAHASSLSSATSQPPALEPLIQSIIERNAIADQVALGKWNGHTPVFDPAREQQLLESVRHKAHRYQLQPDDAALFQLGQMEANRLIQYQLLDRWHREGKVPPTQRISLNELRHQLDTLQDNQLEALARIEPLRHQNDCAETVSRTAQRMARQSTLDNEHRLALTRSLGDICQSPAGA